MTLLRRYLVLAALLFWLGGFTFYASVVVFVGQRQIGHRRQGFITAEVTDALNLSAAIALVILAWDLVSVRDSSVGRRRLLWMCWAGMAITLAGLYWLHAELAELMAVEEYTLIDPALFRRLHRGYLWMNTVQWGCGLGYVALMVLAWRAEDRRLAGQPLREGRPT